MKNLGRLYATVNGEEIDFGNAKVERIVVAPDVDPDIYSIVDGALVFHRELDANESLDLEYCRDLKTLPESLNVGGFLDLFGCSSLESLPNNLTVGGFLDLRDCTSLTSLPDGLTVEGCIDLGGCASLKSLPDNIRFESIYLPGYVSIYLDLMWLDINTDMPETFKHACVGKRIIDVVDHYLLRDHWLGEMIITGFDEDGDFEIAYP